MHLALSTLSLQANWLLCNKEASSILATQKWSIAERSNLSAEIGQNLDKLLEKASLSSDKIHNLYVFEGPGSFTGIRASLSFSLGYSQGLNIPCWGIPTYEIYRAPVYISLRLHKTQNLDLQSALQEDVEFLKITDKRCARLEKPADTDSIVLGLKTSREWPQDNRILDIIQQHQTGSLNLETPHAFYGLEPKISGQRQA